MYIVDAGSGNTITYYTRYLQIHKWEIMDHETRITTSGATNIIGYDGKIFHTGVTYEFDENSQYTYKSYFLTGGTYYLATHLLLHSYSGSTLLDAPFVEPSTISIPTKTFKVFKSNSS